jgi:hypothetical protein
VIEGKVCPCIPQSSIQWAPELRAGWDCPAWRVIGGTACVCVMSSSLHGVSWPVALGPRPMGAAGRGAKGGVRLAWSPGGGASGPGSPCTTACQPEPSSPEHRPAPLPARPFRPVSWGTFQKLPGTLGGSAEGGARGRQWGLCHGCNVRSPG